MDKVALREFTMEDYHTVVDVWLKAGLSLRPGDDYDAIRRKLDRDPELFLTATVAGEIVGTALGAFDGRRGYVYHLAVLPSFQGRGIGKLLLAELERRLAALGCAKMNLTVNPRNTGAIDFYKRLGFNREEHVAMGKEVNR
jgi:ribosomal protein S18 acetylase RimI-like enzyme